MDLNDQIIPHRIKDGFESVQIPAGKSLRIKIVPGEEDMLNVMCPQGKKWVAKIHVNMVETDV